MTPNNGQLSATANPNGCLSVGHQHFHVESVGPCCFSYKNRRQVMSEVDFRWPKLSNAKGCHSAYTNPIYG